MKHWIKLSTGFWLSMALYFIKVFVSIVCVNCVSSKIKLFFHCSLNPGSAVRGYSRSQGNCVIHFRCADIFIHIYLLGVTLPNSAVWQYDTVHHTCMCMHRHKICIEYIETMIRKSKYEWKCKILIRAFDRTTSCVKQENNSQNIIVLFLYCRMNFEFRSFFLLFGSLVN